MEASSLFVSFVNGYGDGGIALPIAALAGKQKGCCCIFLIPWYYVFKES